MQTTIPEFDINFSDLKSDVEQHEGVHFVNRFKFVFDVHFPDVKLRRLVFG